MRIIIELIKKSFSFLIFMFNNNRIFIRVTCKKFWDFMFESYKNLFLISISIIREFFQYYFEF